jgi:hypothetical protein
MQGSPQKLADVYDYFINEEDKRTGKRSIEKVIEHWEGTERTALNCLDFENRIGSCCPLLIIESDLLE